MRRIVATRIGFPMSTINAIMRFMIAGSKAAPRGVIDSLAAGFGIITRRPILALLPVLLDILLLTAPGVRSEALPGWVQSFAAAAIAQSQLSEEDLAATNQQLDSFVATLRDRNLVGLLSWQIPTLRGLFPSVVPGTTVYSLNSMPATALFAAAGVILGLLLVCFYMGLLADAVRRQPREPAAVLARPAAVEGDAPSPAPRARGIRGFLLELGANVLRLGSMRVIQGTLLLLLALAASSPLSVGASVGGLLAGVMLGLFVLTLIFTFLADESVFVSKRAGWLAIRESYAVVRQHFGSSLLLWVLVAVISMGLQIIWFSIATWEIGTLVGIVGNAYIISALATAALVFYNDRKLLQTGTVSQSGGEPGTDA